MQSLTMLVTTFCLLSGVCFNLIIDGHNNNTSANNFSTCTHLPTYREAVEIIETVKLPIKDLCFKLSETSRFGDRYYVNMALKEFSHIIALHTSKVWLRCNKVRVCSPNYQQVLALSSGYWFTIGGLCFIIAIIVLATILYCVYFCCINRGGHLEVTLFTPPKSSTPHYQQQQASNDKHVRFVEDR